MIMRADIDDSIGHRWQGLDASASGITPQPVTGKCVHIAILRTYIDDLVGNGRRGINRSPCCIVPELFTRDGCKGIQVVILRTNIDDFISDNR